MRISRQLAVLLFLLGFGVCLIGCLTGTAPTPTPSPEESGAPWFEDITEKVGLHFVHDPGPTGNYHMREAMGHGCAFIHDGDGTLYLYLLQTAGPKSDSVNRLYKRLPDGKLQDVTEGSGLGVAGYNLGVAIADVNNDGLPDVLLTQYDGIKLFLNLGGGHFEDVTEEAGLSNPVWGASAAFFDYDRDGWLDLFVANYVSYDQSKACTSPNGTKDFCGPHGIPGRPSKLFHNLGPVAAKDGKRAARVRFEDVSVKSGIGKLASAGLGVVCADFNGDGWPDVFVTNDGRPNYLWINQQDGTFLEKAVSSGVAYTGTGKTYANMGIAAGDFSDSGMLDLFVTHLDIETHTLWKQGPKKGEFKDRTVDSGLTGGPWRGTGFGTVAADFDLDGSLDIAFVNGGVGLPAKGGPKDTGLGFWEPYSQRNQLLANDGTGKFNDISLSNKAFCGYYNVGRGLTTTDYDDDGAPDLLVTATGDRARLFRNVAPNRGHWLKVRALDVNRKRDAYGAEVRVRAGGRTWLRVINPAESYLCSGSPVALFGLGKATQIDSIEVRWPDPVGAAPEIFDGMAADRTVVLRKGEGRKP